MSRIQSINVKLNNRNMKEKVLSCPFCQSKPEIVKKPISSLNKTIFNHGVKCPDKDCRLNVEPPYHSTLIAAVYAWNGWKNRNKNSITVEIT